MSKIIVYSPEGEAFEREPVDARELVAMGWSTTPPNEEVPASIEDTPVSKKGKK